jgi:hypothetical protein
MEILYHLEGAPKDLAYIPQTESYQLRLILHNKYWFKHLKNPCYRVKEYAVCNNQKAISYIKDPEDSLVRTMLAVYPNSIKYVHNVTNEQLEHAFLLNPNLKNANHLKTFKNISPVQRLWFMSLMYCFNVQYEHKVMYYYKSSKYKTKVFLSSDPTEDTYVEYYENTSEIIDILTNKGLAVLALRTKHKDLARLALKYKTVDLLLL